MSTYGTYEIRACWKSSDGGIESHPFDPDVNPNSTGWALEADFFGVYKNLPDGRQEWVADFNLLSDAQQWAEIEAGSDDGLDPDNLTGMDLGED